MTFQTLISAVNENVDVLLEKMKIESDSVVVNQCDCDSTDSLEYMNHHVKVIMQNARGVGLSRNTALDNASADICLFSDEDIEYFPNYEKTVLAAFEKYEDASVIAFNFEVDVRRRTYINEDDHEVKWFNYGRYPAYALAIKRESIVKNNIRYSLLFGGGAKYSNGEDSLFLHDCLRKGLKIYASKEYLGKENYRESTWFKGYTDKFFFDRGVLYHFLYGKLASLFGFRFLFNNRKVMCKQIGLFKAYSLLRKGIREGKTI